MLALIQSFLMYIKVEIIILSDKICQLLKAYKMSYKIIYNLQKMDIIFESRIHSNHTSMSGVFNFNYMGCT